MATRTIGKNTEKIPIYQNTFSSPKDFGDVTVVYGEMEVRDGALRTVSSEGHSTALLNIAGGHSFVFEADFINHTGGGGIFFGGSEGRFKTSTPESDKANGYYAYVGKDGTLGAFGCTNTLGVWSGNITSSPEGRFEIGCDLHFYIRVSGDYIIYILSDCKSGKEYYRAEYKKGDSRFDSSPFERGVIGIRINNDGGKGGFTNLKLYSFKEVQSSSAVLGISEKLSAKLTATDFEELVVFANGGQGYAFSYDGATERLLAYRYLYGKVFFIAEHAMQITKGRKYDFLALNRGDVLAFYFGSLLYPVLEIKVPKLTSFTVGTTAEIPIEIGKAVLYDGPTYINPVTYGADPEILYHDGIFYLYTLDHTSKFCRVRVRTSTNLYEWEEAGFAFELDENSPIHYFMSPNVFCKDGYFYLLIASQAGGEFGATDFHIFYAAAKSPLGPFKMNAEKPYINPECEIGGAPFIDDDGKIYITTVRFGGGNHVYIQEIDASEGILSTKRDAVRCISPTEYYEIDEYGRISEGGVITKHNGYYYMMYAAGHFRGHYGEAYAVSRNIYGPYEKNKYNEIISSTLYSDGAGDCMFVLCPTLEENYVVYHRHSVRGNKGFDRDICIDRFYFVPSEDGGPDILKVYGPTDTPVPAPKFKK